MSDVVRFDAKSIGEKVRERIEASVLELIPQETIEAMIKVSIDGFLVSFDGKPSKLQGIINEHIHLVLKEKVMNQLNYSFDWNGNANDALVQTIKQAVADPNCINNILIGLGVSIMRQATIGMQMNR